MLGGGVPPLEKVVPNCNKDFAPLLKKWIENKIKIVG